MPTLLDYRRRVRSVKNTQQITRAMKFVAAAKLRRAQEALLAARPYAYQIRRMLRSVQARVEGAPHPLLERRPEQKILTLVLTGDRSLAGAFNTNVIRRALEFLKEMEGKQVEVIAVGHKGRDALKKRGLNMVGEYLDVSQKVEFGKAKDIATQAAEIYTSGAADAVYVVYNEFKNVMVQQLQVEKLLPIEPPAHPEEDLGGGSGGEGLPHEVAASGANLVDYIYEQPPEEIFAALVPRYLQSEIFRVLLESATAEHAARMMAMESATNNAADLIDTLTLEMNKIRQAGITKEIIEIVSGASYTAN
jgi:F-type H+-transporting ATPase subunit gamma